MCVCLSVWLFLCLSCHIKSIWKARGIVRTILARACYIPSFKKFHAHVHAISHDFTQLLRILGYFSRFWAIFNMLDIKKHVLKPRNSLVILSRSSSRSFTQISCNFQAIWTTSAIFWPILTC